jgi:signal peptidase I
MASSTKPSTGETIWDNAKTIGIALLIALVIRSLLFQPFNIPSGSMMGTLLVGDYLFVSKFTYGYSQYSLPFGIIPFEGRVVGREPTRGDVVVFKLPSDNRTDYIKRVIGLPGDRIQVTGGVLFINDEAVPRERVEDFAYRLNDGRVVYVPQYRETLPNGVAYMTLDSMPQGPMDNTGVYVVPEGHLFMMGDNRDNSADSREPSAVGYVPEENVVGRAEIKFFSTDGSAALWEFWRWPGATRWGRILQGID